MYLVKTHHKIMKNIRTIVALVAFSTAGLAIAGEIDVIDASDAQAGTYFTPDDASKYNSPYYRWHDEDWGWTHNALTAPFTTAELSVSGFDVDFSSGEFDLIEAYDTQTATWLSLGLLAGGSDIWQFTTFLLSAQLHDEVASGLQVRVNIDTGNNVDFWALTLGKSTLTTDGVGPGNPTPGVPDSGTSALLLGIGLCTLQAFRRRRA